MDNVSDLLEDKATQKLPILVKEIILKYLIAAKIEEKKNVSRLGSITRRINLGRQLGRLCCGGESIWTVFEIGFDNEYDDEYYDDGAFVFDRDQEDEIALEAAIEEGEPLIV